MNVEGLRQVRLAEWRGADVAGPPPQFSVPRGSLTLASLAERNMENPRSWAGIAGQDAALLATLLERLELRPSVMYTDVPLLSYEGKPLDDLDIAAARMWTKRWARRIDCVLKVGEEWSIVEFKPCADHYCFGQCMFYWFHASREYKELARCSCLCVTDRLENGCRELFNAFGVGCIELDGVLEPQSGGRGVFEPKHRGLDVV